MKKNVVFALSTFFYCFNIEATNAMEELKLLRQQMKMLETKIQQLENQYRASSVTTQKPVVTIPKQQLSENKSAIKNDHINDKNTTIPAQFSSTPTLPNSTEPDIQEKFWPLFGTNTQMSISGFIKLVGIRDIAGNMTKSLPGDKCGDGRYWVTARNIDVSGKNQTRDLHMSARESRLSIETISPIEGSNLRTHIETDFFGDGGGSDTISSSYNVRLRKAYMQFKGFTIGQNSSAFTDMSTFPETIDCNGPVGNCKLRQAQLKYSHNLNDNLVLDVAVENPESEAITDKGSKITSSSSSTSSEYKDGIKCEKHMPDFIAAVQYNQDWGHFRMAGVIRQNVIKIENTKDTKSRIGFALDTTLAYNLAENDGIVAQMGYGTGAGRYFTESVMTATYYDGNKLHNEKSFHTSIGYKHRWTKEYNLRSTIALGYVRMMNSDALKKFVNSETNAGDNYTTIEGNKNDINKYVASLHLNLQADVTQNTHVGIEYIQAKRKTERNKSATLKRLVFGAKVDF